MEVGTILKTTVFIRSSVIMSKLKKNYSSVKFWIHWIDGEYFLGSVKINVSNRLGFWPLQSSWTSIGQSKVQTATGSCCSDNR